MPRSLRTVAFVLLLSLLVAPLPPDAAAAAAMGERAGPAEPNAVPGPGLAAGSARLSRVWWNQESHVEALALSDEQRDAMDRALVDHLERRRGLAAEAARQRRALGERLAAGDWRGAEDATADVAAAHAALGRGEAELAVAVARLLSEEQRRTVAEEFPRLFDRPLVVGGVGGRFRGRLGAAPGAGRAPRPRSPGGGSTPGSPPPR